MYIIEIPKDRVPELLLQERSAKGLDMENIAYSKIGKSVATPSESHLRASQSGKSLTR